MRNIPLLSILAFSFFTGPFIFGQETVYVDEALDIRPINASIGNTVTWREGTSEEVSGLIFGTTAFTSVQDAINAVDTGGTVKIAPGTFVEGEEISIAKSITLAGSGSDVTLLSGNDTVRVIKISGAGNVVLMEDLAIVDGRTRGTDGTESAPGLPGTGGGLCHIESSLTMRRCRVEGNVAVGGEGFAKLDVHPNIVHDGSESQGGGIFSNGSLMLEECVVQRNFCAGADGFILPSSIPLEGADGIYAGGRGKGGGIYVKGGTAEISNCSIQSNIIRSGSGGNADGGGVYVAVDGTLIGNNSTFANNVAGGGAPTGEIVGGFTISGTGFGGALNNRGVCELRNCTIFGNVCTASSSLSEDEGGGASRNFSIVGLGFGGGIVDGGMLLMEHCTVVRNSAAFGGAISGGGESPSVNNCLIAGNHQLRQEELFLFNVDVSKNQVGIPGGATLADLVSENLRDNGGPTQTLSLPAGSVAINAGDSFLTTTTTDQRGYPYSRIQDGEVDYGAVEVDDLPEVISVGPPPNSGGIPADTVFSITFDRNVVIANAGEIDLFDQVTGDSLANSVTQISPTVIRISPDLPLASLGKIELRVLVDAITTAAGEPYPGGTFQYALNQPEVFVANDADFSPQNPSSGDMVTWRPGTDQERAGLIFGTNAFNSVSEAVAIVTEGEVIQIAPGTYDEGEEIEISKSVTLRGAGFDQTFLSGNADSDGNTEPGEHRVIVIQGEGNEVVVERLAIVNGQAPTNGSGGGIRNTSGNTLIVREVHFEGNRARLGAGIVNDASSSLDVYRSSFVDNNASNSGGGIFSTIASAKIDSCTFSQNRAGSGGGGGFNNNSAIALIQNCTFSSNWGSSGGGIRNGASSQMVMESTTITKNLLLSGGGGGMKNEGALTMTNCLILGNSGSLGPDFEKTTTGSVTLGGRNFIGNLSRSTLSAGEDLLTLEPGQNVAQVLDQSLSENGGTTLTHTLIVGSPAINAGLSAGTAVYTDQRGFMRPLGGAVDLGAVEFSPLIEWRRLHGLDLEGADDFENPAGDGVVNLAKYAFNLAPNAGDLEEKNAILLSESGVAGLPRSGKNERGEPYVEIVRRREQSSPGISYLLEGTTDLVNFVGISFFESQTVVIDDVWERVRLVPPLGEDRLFYRIRIEESLR